MILEAKAGVVAAVSIGIVGLGAWSSRFVTSALQANGIVIESGAVIQLVTTAVIVGIAFATVRTKVDAMSKRFDDFEETLGKIEKHIERLDEKTRNHTKEIDRLREDTPPFPRRGFRQPSDDAEDV